jgi:hypothetical protein
MAALTYQVVVAQLKLELIAELNTENYALATKRSERAQAGTEEALQPRMHVGSGKR